jgi:hypothetical protein
VNLKETELNLNDQQFKLLVRLVLDGESHPGAEFLVVRSLNAVGLGYDGSPLVPIAFGIADFQRLQIENLIDFHRINPNVYRGQLTQLGKDALRRHNDNPRERLQAAAAVELPPSSSGRVDGVVADDLLTFIREFPADHPQTAMLAKFASSIGTAGGRFEAKYATRPLGGKKPAPTAAIELAVSHFSTVCLNSVSTVTDMQSAAECEQVLNDLRSKILDWFHTLLATVVPEAAEPTFRKWSPVLMRRLSEVLGRAKVKLWAGVSAQGSVSRKKRLEVTPKRKSSASKRSRRIPNNDRGSNIDRLRKECGWTFDELADQTKIDKTLILGHVNQGKGAYPGTLKKYADAFSKGMKRVISVAELGD